ncbi:hypothetical protein AC578_3372 [Pseudocercospora eumusae]|uniref:Uncharacterized protein n=1 Tax=Pseudocercospora eumusae TaxID=321146 RepID=A0A139GV79_9PEZI|nr:hypothetical protein AC578_3372 [Pseudocercospora eumusae]
MLTNAQQANKQERLMLGFAGADINVDTAEGKAFELLAGAEHGLVRRPGCDPLDIVLSPFVAAVSTMPSKVIAEPPTDVTIDQPGEIPSVHAAWLLSCME